MLEPPGWDKSILEFVSHAQTARRAVATRAERDLLAAVYELMRIGIRT